MPWMKPSLVPNGKGAAIAVKNDRLIKATPLRQIFFSMDCMGSSETSLNDELFCYAALDLDRRAWRALHFLINQPVALETCSARRSKLFSAANRPLPSRERAS